MKALTRILSFSLVCLILFTGCNDDSPINMPGDQPPHCTVVHTTEVEFPASGFPRMSVTVMNDGDGPTAYRVGCYVRLKKGGQVVDEDEALIGTLKQNESASAEAWFTSTSSVSDFDTIETEAYWYDAENKYYEED